MRPLRLPGKYLRNLRNPEKYLRNNGYPGSPESVKICLSARNGDPRYWAFPNVRSTASKTIPEERFNLRGTISNVRKRPVPGITIPGT